MPLADIDLDAEDLRAVVDVVRSKWLSMGPVTAEFEQRFADYIGVKYAFAVVNCTAALHLAHVALGAGVGDTIICPSLTFVAAANAIRYTGAMPVFADITSANDLTLSPDDIEGPRSPGLPLPFAGTTAYPRTISSLFFCETATAEPLSCNLCKTAASKRAFTIRLSITFRIIVP